MKGDYEEFQALRRRKNKANSKPNKAESVAKKLDDMRLKKAAQIVRDGAAETFGYYAIPREHWRQLRTNNPLERIMREIRRRSRVVGCFPDGNSALMLAAAKLRHIAWTR